MKEDEQWLTVPIPTLNIYFRELKDLGRFPVGTISLILPNDPFFHLNMMLFISRRLQACISSF